MSRSTHWFSKPDVNHIIFTFRLLISHFKRSLFSNISSLQRTSSPPFNNMDQYSKVVASNEADPVLNSIFFPERFTYFVPRTRLTMLRFSIITPFGLPVEPDVYITYAMSEPLLSMTGKPVGCWLIYFHSSSIRTINWFSRFPSLVRLFLLQSNNRAFTSCNIK